MVTVFVPGRLCLLGEHSDWAGALRATDARIVPGACLITGTDQGITATATPADDFEISTCLPDGSTQGPFRVALRAAALQEAVARHGFFSYAAGVAAEVWARYRPPGVRIEVTAMDLPVRRGLSSSAAICVLVARAFSEVHGLRLGVREEMELAYRGEVAAGSQCGRMDQACAYGKRPVLLGFDGEAMSVEVLRPRRPLSLLIVDLGRHKDTRRILAELHACFTAAGARSDALRAALGSRNAALVGCARAALEAGDAAALGALMTEAQEVFDEAVAPACPAELTAPRLHTVLRCGPARELAWGGKGVGSQGDGAAQFVCRGPEERDELARRLAAASLGTCLPLTVGFADASNPI